MKKIINLFMMATIFMIAISCNSYDTPTKAMEQYLKVLVDGNYEKFVDGMAFKGDDNEEERNKAKEEFKALLEDKVQKENDKREGMKGFEIISEQISEDGKTAVVEYKLIYGDGTEKKDRQAMINRDGKWMMNMNK